MFELIRNFICSGSPVGSETLSRNMPGEQKPSTLRYNLGKLEESGYLRKAHASSGRLPTDKAYREYVGALVDRTFLSGDEEHEIRTTLETVRAELDALIRKASEVMAIHSDLMSVVIAPEPNLVKINVVRLVPLSTTSLLIVVVTGNEATHTRIVHLPIEITRLDLSTLEHSLQTRLHGMRIFDIDDAMLSDIFARAHVNQFAVLNIRRPVEEFLRELRFGKSGRLQVKGRERIAALGDDPEHIGNVLELIDDEEQLVRLLTTVEGSAGVRALIGSDFTREGFERVAMIFSDFNALGDSRGKVGVLGPRRMNYSRIIPLVRLISEILEEKFSGTSLVLE